MGRDHWMGGTWITLQFLLRQAKTVKYVNRKTKAEAVSWIWMLAIYHDVDCLVLRRSSWTCCHSNRSVSLNLLASWLISSPVILWKKVEQIATEANSTDFVSSIWVRKKKPRRIPLGEILILTFRYHHENHWVDYLHQDKQKMYYIFF